MSGRPRRVSADRLAAVVLACFGVFWMVAAKQQQFLVDTPYVSLSFVPFVAGAILTLLCGYLAVVPAATVEDAPASDADAPPERANIYPFIRVGLAFAALAVYGVLLPRVHALATTFGIAFVGLVLCGEPLRPRVFVIAAVIAVVLFAIFVVWLSVPLPGGRFS